MAIGWIEQTKITNRDLDLAIKEYLDEPEHFKGEIYHLILEEECLEREMFERLYDYICRFIDNYKFDTTDFFTFQNNAMNIYSDFSIDDNQLNEIIQKINFEEFTKDLIDLILTHRITHKAYELKQYSIMIERLAQTQSLLTRLICTFGAWRVDTDVIKSLMQSENAQKGWKVHNEQRKHLKERYLAIMRNKDNPFHTVSSATDYIYVKENPEQKKYRWIYDRLTEATKGNFD